MNYQEAYELLTTYTEKEGLREHALSVAKAMKAYAAHYGENPEEWEIVGLLHDFDYERYPDAAQHPYKGAEILREKQVPEEWVEAILGHAAYTGVERKTLLAKTLFAVDELSGLITACALVRPNGLEDLEAKSVKKKMKDKSFAATVNREDIKNGAEELGVDLDTHITFVIQALKS